MILAPLSACDGGFGSCRDPQTDTPATVFSSFQDPDYQCLLALARRGKAFLEQNKRFDMPGFAPRPEWVREMKRYGILSAEATPETICNPYAVEQEYWRSLWYQPSEIKLSEAVR